MSRHLLVDRPTVQIVLGFDRMLCSYFGQVFNPAGRWGEGVALAGWPTRSGLGTRRPVWTRDERDADLHLLRAWAEERQLPEVWLDDTATNHLDRIISILRLEWLDGEDHASVPVPPVLREASRP